jgi:diaminopimelate decarboxylase
MSALPHDLLPDTATVGEDGALSVGGCDLVDLGRRYGTPLFVYDEDHMRARCREAAAEMGPGGAVYATKAFLCRAMARLVFEEGLGLDVATGGELHVALGAGVPPDRMVMHGNNKSTAELRAALTVGVGRVVIDSFEEIERIERLVDEGLPAPKVLIRLTPGVEAHTHEYIATGQDDSKFGFTVSNGTAARATTRVLASSAMELVGFHTHIGSLVFRVESFADALGVVAEFSRPYGLPELSMGGGLGVPYVEGESAPTVAAWCRTLKEGAARLGISARLSVEPGRSIAAAAGITLYEIGTVKRIPDVRTYVAVDGGMSDNPRPVLYGSGYETFLPRAVEADRDEPIRLVGKHCESGDLLVREGRLPSGFTVGDIVATPVTGAYGHSMGSNYNKVLRPAVVFVSGGESRLVVRRETYDDLLVTDVG